MSEINKDQRTLNGGGNCNEPYEPRYMEGHAISVRFAHPDYSDQETKPYVKIDGIVQSVDTENGVYHVTLDNDLGEVRVDIRETDKFMAEQFSAFDGAMDGPAPNIGS